MTPNQIALIQRSFARIVPERVAFGVRFYERLFLLDPTLRALFRADIASQVRHLIAALHMVVRSLDDLEPVLDQIVALGRRHGAYGVKDEHFAVVGQALVETLGETLRADFTPDVKEAWIAAYGVLSETMMQALRTHGIDARSESRRNILVVDAEMIGVA